MAEKSPATMPKSTRSQSRGLWTFLRATSLRLPAPLRAPSRHRILVRTCMTRKKVDDIEQTRRRNVLSMISKKDINSCDSNLQRWRKVQDHRPPSAIEATCGQRCLALRPMLVSNVYLLNFWRSLPCPNQNESRPLWKLTSQKPLLKTHLCKIPLLVSPRHMRKLRSDSL